MTLFLEKYDKSEGIVQKEILPRIISLNSDNVINEIKENIFESYANLTGEYLKKVIMSFDIFSMPPSNVITDFPIQYQKSLLQFKSDLLNLDEMSYSNFLSNLFDLFNNPSSDFILTLMSTAIKVDVISKYSFINTNEDIKKILKYITENTNILSSVNNDQMNLINSYISFFIIDANHFFGYLFNKKKKRKAT